MLQDELTDAERMFIDTLPGPPAFANVRTTTVWIIEWLAPEETLTGLKLQEWMEQRRPGWSVYCPCETKADVLAAIKRAEDWAQTTAMVPVLHIESHGGTHGLTPTSASDAEWLTWEELTVPLQRLNLVTRCNVIMVVAACVGYAAVQAFNKGPRAPAIALVGPDTNVSPSKLFDGVKELYRRWQDTRGLTEIVESASREMGEVHFELEPFTTLCFEAMVTGLVKSIRRPERQERMERLRLRLLAETQLTREQIDSRMPQLPLLPAWSEMQRLWDEMFMIDIWPENKERFGIDLKDIIGRIESFAADLT